MSQEKIRKHKIYDHPIIGTIVGMILAIIAYSLLIGLILPIFVEKIILLRQVLLELLA